MPEDREEEKGLVVATSGLLSALEDPPPGTSGLWGRWSERQRAAARLGLACTGFLAFAGISWGLREAYGEDFLHRWLSRLIFKAGLAIFLFGGVYVFIWGALGVVTGRPWNALPSVARIVTLVVLTPVVAAPAFTLVAFPDVIVDGVRHAEWFKSLSPAYVEIRRHVTALSGLREKCDHAEDLLACECRNRVAINGQIAAVEGIVAAHPEQRGFEVLLPDPRRPNVSDMYDLEMVRLRHEDGLGCDLVPSP